MRKPHYIVAALITLLLITLASVALLVYLPKSTPTIVVRDINAGNQLPQLTSPIALTSNELRPEFDELVLLQTKRTTQIAERTTRWTSAPIQRWNEIARNLVAQRGVVPTRATRIYALLSVAQYDALAVAERYHLQFRDMRPRDKYSYPSTHAVIATASAQVLSYLFPQDTAGLAQAAKEHQESALYEGINLRSDLAAGESVGKWAAQQIIEYAQKDSADTLYVGAVPLGSNYWRSQLVALPTPNPSSPPGERVPVTEQALGVTPHWGNIQPWIMSSGSQFRPPAPPEVGSVAFATALAEIRQLSDTRTPEELRVAQFWSDGINTDTPAGHWNRIAVDLLREAKLNDPFVNAKIFATLNMAMADAAIACWDAKYTYWYLRPSQADAAITVPIGLPNHPSYPSGHSCISSAASEVLAHFIPNRANDLREATKQASISRLYAGIHWRFDAEAGLEIGQKIAALAIRKL